MFSIRKVKVAEIEVECFVSPDGRLLWPKDWNDELEEHGFLDAATSILAGMDAAASDVPWIIGSASLNLFGQPRSESASHMEGKAFDMSPMRSESVAVEPGAPIMGLAWDLISLMEISQAAGGGIPFVVEGDHLHVQPQAKGGLGPGQLYAVWTFPDWYEWTSVAAATPLGAAARNTVWLWDLSTLTLTPPSAAQTQAMVEYLS